ncbi:MAG TPA: zinc ABC transporter ATP-binding protein, partial [Alphaproteobacteria bacterium]|jgi:zinc transport system ATP-binding protein|nr:zinc ABC transporter ATP-binding protein [Alphaproteobacteria bacterium]
VNRFLRLTNRASSRQMEEALALTGTDHLAKAQMSKLSGGEFQRVLLARAILRTPEFLVLDEPVQGVDFNGEIALYKLIEDIRTRLNCGVLLISHDLHVVMSKTDRVICLNGHICCSGTPATVASSDEFKSLFGDQAAPGLALYEHRHDHEHLPDGGVVQIGDEDAAADSSSGNKPGTTTGTRVDA